MDARLPVVANRYDRREWAGAFGDLGTLIPFLLGYLAVLGLDPAGVLLAFGVALIAAGLYYRTPFPVQPMKAIGAAAVTQVAALGVTVATVQAAALLTGVIWLALALFGIAERIRRWMPRSVANGIVLGLALAFLLDGAQRMLTTWWLGAGALLLWLALRRNRHVPVMFLLLALGVVFSLSQDATLAAALQAARPALRLPAFSLAGIGWNDLLLAAAVLVLPQLPLTVGNALIAITEENNRLFADRPVSGRSVALSTGLMNLGAAVTGGVPMCHGAGGMAAHVSFGARTGGASVILGVVLTGLGLFLADSVGVFFRLVPEAVLGAILFVAGIQLAIAPVRALRDDDGRTAVLVTATIGVWNIGWGFVAGLCVHYVIERLAQMKAR